MTPLVCTMVPCRFIASFPQEDDQVMINSQNIYQNIMFLTLLPAISGKHSSPTGEKTKIDQQNPKDPPGIRINSEPSKSAKRERKRNFPNVNHFEEAMSVNNSGCRAIQEQPNLVKTNGDTRHQKLSTPTNLDVPFSHTNYKGRRKSKSESGEQMTQTMLSKHFSLDELNHQSIEANVNNLDLTTLTTLVLESRRRIFGEEWMKRKDLVTPQSKEEVGSIGISKPRRLTPLSTKPDHEVSSMELHHSSLKPLSKHAFPAHLPTPSGLHLSANFSQLLLSDPEASFNSERGGGGSRKLFRRLNSLSEISRMEIDERVLLPTADRPSSAPDIPKKVKSDSVDSSSPPMITPARANTPTEASKSAKAIRPQLIGGSLVTCSPEQSFSVSGKPKLKEDGATLFLREMINETSTQNTLSNATSVTAERPQRKSLPSKLALNSKIENRDDFTPPFSIKSQRLPQKSSRLRLMPLSKSNKKHSLP